MYSMIKTITMKHSRKRKNLRLSISSTSLLIGKWPTAVQQRIPFARVSPVASFEVASILPSALFFVKYLY